MANRFIFIQDIFYTSLVSSRVLGIILLLETGKCSLFIPCETHRPVGINSFVVNNVNKNFLNSPFVFSVSIVQFFLGQREYKLLRCNEIILEMFQKQSICRQ